MKIVVAKQDIGTSPYIHEHDAIGYHIEGWKWTERRKMYKYQKRAIKTEEVWQVGAWMEGDPS